LAAACFRRSRQIGRRRKSVLLAAATVFEAWPSGGMGVVFSA
jgi:hypothetical protein